MLLNVTDRVLEIYTDGACIPNPGPGGWGALLRYGSHEKELCGGESGVTTNNRMELTAPIMALESLTRPSVVHVHTDSTYVKNGITQWVPKWKTSGWLTSARQPVKNEDLWKRLEAAASLHDVEWFWVKGHAGHAENERADQLAERGLLEASPDASVPTPRTESAHDAVQCGAVTKSGKPCRAVTRGGLCQRHQNDLTLT